jgi:putative PIN family toxin of toxin-antitoxin system
LDTNVLISAILSPQNIPARIIELLWQQVFAVVVTEDILSEYATALRYEKVTRRHKLSDEGLLRYLQDLRSATIMVVPTKQLKVAPDPKDDKFFECALAGSAHFIISGDRHLHAVKQYQDVVVLSPAQFLTMLGDRV